MIQVESLTPNDLSLRSSALDDGFVQDLLSRVYGREGEMSPLSSERDAIFRVKQRLAESVVLRISLRQGSNSELGLQCALLDHILSRDPDLPVPRPLATRAGRLVEPFDRHGLKLEAALFTYMGGAPVADVHRSPAQRRAIGRALSRLDLALSTFACDNACVSHPWNMLEAPTLIAVAQSLPSGDTRSATVEALADFTALAMPVLQGLPHQYIHNDFNPRNILVDPASPSKITGIIDFGDIVQAPRIVDLAVAIARQIGPGQPIVDASQIVEAYNSHSPLNAAEIEVLYDLVCTRLAMRIAIWSQRLGTDRSRVNRTEINATASLLATLRMSGRAFATTCFLTAAMAR